MEVGSAAELGEQIAESARNSTKPYIVAIDGRSGAGKSTLARLLTEKLGAVVIDGDDFYSGGTVAEWKSMTPAERAARCMDWQRQRAVLEALARGESATWHPYDWIADDGRLSVRSSTVHPASVVILEGAYSARPELADLLDLRVLLDAPDEVRRRHLNQREGEHYRVEWDALWAAAEQWYFDNVMPRETFDLVIDIAPDFGT